MAGQPDDHDQQPGHHDHLGDHDHLGRPGPDQPDFVPVEPVPVPPRSQDPASWPTAPILDQDARSTATPSMPIQVQVPPPAAGRPRRRRGPIIAICAVLVGVLVLLTVADRIMVQVAGDKVGSTLQTALGTPERPEVSFGGFPFLNQLATSDFSSVEVSAQDFSVETPTEPLQVDELTASLTDVTGDDDFSTLEVGGLEASTAISYDSLGSFIGRPISYDGTRAGRSRIAIKITDSISVSGAPTFDPDSQRLGLDDSEFKIGDRTVSGTAFNSLLQGLLQVTFPELMPGVAVSDVRAARDNLVLSWEGADLRLDR